jgi:hypothetical protein
LIIRPLAGGDRAPHRRAACSQTINVHIRTEKRYIYIYTYIYIYIHQALPIQVGGGAFQLPSDPHVRVPSVVDKAYPSLHVNVAVDGNFPEFVTVTAP